MKIVLLNIPGDRLYIRSYYCGSTSKASYLFQPLDLLILSGRLSRKGELSVMDCIADRIDNDTAISRIEECRADVIVSIVSIVSWDSDAAFLSQLKRRLPGLRIIVTGDVFFDQPETLLEENKFIDAVLFDFISNDIVHYLEGNDEAVSNMAYRRQGGIILKRGRKDVGHVFSLPTPRHDLFLNKRYRFPFARSYPFTTVLTNFGCPFQCSFCIANKLGFAYRKADEVIEELRYIRDLGVREIFFEDMTFGLPRENVEKLCNMMIAEKLKFGWTCFSRVDLVDRKLLLLMQKSGCHTVIFGVESANDDILEIHRKGYKISQAQDIFGVCRKLGIRTVATFILGLPEETRQTCLETIRLAKKIGCDYASFNIAVPRPGTDLRKRAIESGLITGGQLNFDHSGRLACMPSKSLSAGELLKFKLKATREFYLRPSYLLRRLTAIRSLSELKDSAREFCGLFRNNIH